MKFFYKIYILIYLILLISLFTDNTFALDPITAQQTEFYSSYNPIEDQFLTVWTDCRTSLGLSSFGHSCSYGVRGVGDIFGQIINGNGSCFGGNFQISEEPPMPTPIPTNHQQSHTSKGLSGVVFNPDYHEYLVVWQGLKFDFAAYANPDPAYFERGYDLFAQRISAGGQKIGNNYKIAPNPPLSRMSPCNGNVSNPPQECDDNQWYPHIAYSTKSHRYMVVWHDARMRSRYFHQIPGYWEDATDTSTFKDIFGQILGSDGSPIGDNFPVSRDPGNTTHIFNGNAKRIQQYADITYDSKNDRFFVVWEDDRDGTGNPHPICQKYSCLNLNIYGGFFDTNGQPIGNNIQISGLSAETERYPRASYNPVTNKFFIVWQSTQKPNCSTGPTPTPRGAIPCYESVQSNQPIKVYGKILEENGTLSSQYEIESLSSIYVNYNSFTDEDPPRQEVTVYPDGKFLVTWEKQSEGKIKGRWIEQNGTMGNPIIVAPRVGEDFPILRNKIQNPELLIIGSQIISSPNSGMVFKTQSMPNYINCPATGGPPNTTPYPTPTIGPEPTATPTGENPPTNTPTPTTNTPTPTPTTPACPGLVGIPNSQKFSLWKTQFLNPPAILTEDYNCDQKITLSDFEIWRKLFTP